MKYLLVLIFCLWSAPALALPYELVEDGIPSKTDGFELNKDYAFTLHYNQAFIWMRDPLRKIQTIELGKTGYCQAFFFKHHLISKCFMDASYKVWNPITGKQLGEYAANGFGSNNEALLHDEQYLVYSASRPVFNIWNPDTGKLRYSIKPPKWPLAWKYSGHRLALAYEQEVELWNIKTGELELKQKISKGQISDIAIDKDRFAISNDSGLITVYTLTGDLLKSLQVEALIDSNSKEPQKFIWLAPGERSYSYPQPPRPDKKLLFSHNFEQIALQGDWLAGLSADYSLPGATLYNLKTGEKRTLFNKQHFSKIELSYPWLVADQFAYHFPDGRQGKIEAVQILPKQGVFMVRENHELQIRSLTDFKTKFRLASPYSEINSDYEGHRLAISNGNQIVLHQLKSSQKPLHLKVNGKLLGFGLTEDTLISQSIDDELLLWDLSQHRLITNIPAPGPLAKVALSEPWLALATTDTDFQNLHLYNSTTGQKRFSLNGPTTQLNLLALTNKQLWTSSGSVLQSWNLEARQLQQTMELSYQPDLLFPEAGVVVNNMSLYKSDEIDPFLRWNPLIQRFEPWSIQEADIKKLLQSDAFLTEGQPLIFTNDQYQPFAPNVAQAQENLWWQKDNELYIIQTTLGQMQLHRTDLVSGQRQLIYSENASEVSILDANAERVLLRQPEQGLIRIDWKSGQIQHWLKDYKPPINAVTDSQPDKIIGNLLFQLELFPEPAHTRVSVWDLEANQLKYRFKSDKILSDIKARFSDGHVLLSGKTAYDQEQYFLQAWSLNNGQILADRQLTNQGCDSQFAYQPALQTVSSKNLADGQSQIQICDFKGQILAQYKLKQQAAQQPFLAANKLYLIQSDGNIEIREPLSGRLTQRLDTLARHLKQTQQRISNILETDGYLTIQTGERPSADSRGQNQQSITVILELKTGKLFKLPGWISILNITDQYLTLIFYDSEHPQTAKVPRNKLAQAESYLDPSLQPMVYSFADGLFMLAPDGSFAGYGNYQQYLHISQKGQMIAWDEAIRRWQKPGALILNNP